jgi:RNA polymerase sigma-70 factor, ECF subfamily
MPRDTHPTQRRLNPTTALGARDLRMLVALVRAALDDLGCAMTGHRLAVAGVPEPYGVGGLVMSVEVSEGRRRPSPARRPSPPPAAPVARASGAATDPDARAAVDVEHAETWDLVRRAQAGDGAAFAGLYDRYVDTVYRFLYYRVNDRALAEDFTSETFLRALRRIGTISYQGRDIGAWFVTIARNIVLDHVKSARHRLEVSTGEAVEGREFAQSTEAAVLQTLDAERLMAAVGQLGDEQRECVSLRFIQGFSVSETAAAMGKNDGAIKALQHRAVRKLAELIGQQDR